MYRNLVTFNHSTFYFGTASTCPVCPEDGFGDSAKYVRAGMSGCPECPVGSAWVTPRATGSTACRSGVGEIP